MYLVDERIVDIFEFFFLYRCRICCDVRTICIDATIFNARLNFSSRTSARSGSDAGQFDDHFSGMEAADGKRT